MSVLRALGLAKSYKSRQVLRDLSLEVESGEVVGLLGPNGAGKTTAFYMIVGLTRCEHGEIFLDNKDISRLPMHRRAQLGLGYSPYLEEMLHSDCQCIDLLHVLPVDLNLLEYNLGIAIVGGRRPEYYYRHPHFECSSAVSIFQDLKWSDKKKRNIVESNLRIFLPRTI